MEENDVEVEGAFAVMDGSEKSEVECSSLERYFVRRGEEVFANLESKIE